MNYIKIFQNAQALSVSVRKTYSEDQLMHTFLDNFHQGGKYSSQIASTNQKSLSISSLQTDYINIASSSGFGINSERANTFQTKFTFCGYANHSAEKIQKDQKGKGKSSCVWLFGQQTNGMYAL